MGVLVLALVACGAGTGGRRVGYRTAVSVVADARASFVTETGWTVTLSEACISLGPFTFQEGPRAVSRRAGLLDGLIPVAHAHPGTDHFEGGEVRGEWLAQVTVGLFGVTEVSSGRLEGTAGSLRAVSLELHPARDGALGGAACLRGHQAYLVGVARRGTDEVAFEGGLDIERAGQKRVVSGLAMTGELDEDVVLRVEVDPRAWLAGAQFDRLPRGDDGGVRRITPETQVHAAWFVGARSVGAFRVSAAPSRVAKEVAR